MMDTDIVHEAAWRSAAKYRDEEPPGEVPGGGLVAALARVGAATERVEKQVQQLEDRLTPLLVEGDVNKSPSPQPKGGPVSNLTEQVDSLADYVQRISDRLGDLHRRVDL